MDNAGPDKSHFLNIVGCCNFTIYRGKKSRGVYSFTVQGAISQKRTTFCNKSLCLALECVHHFRLLGGSDFGSKACKIVPPIKDHLYKVAYSFWLFVHMRCLFLCAPSYIAVVRYDWVLQVIAFGAQTTLNFVSNNLNAIEHDVWTISNIFILQTTFQMARRDI